MPLPHSLNQRVLAEPFYLTTPGDRTLGSTAITSFDVAFDLHRFDPLKIIFGKKSFARSCSFLATPGNCSLGSTAITSFDVALDLHGFGPFKVLRL
jgi:hypothetical protein